MPTAIGDNTTVRELVGRYPQTRPIFEKYGIDYCCGGGKCLAESAVGTGATASELLAALQGAIVAPIDGTAIARNWFEAPLHELVDHILKTHHAYVKEALPRLSSLLRKVLHAHGAHHGDMLREVHSQFSLLDEELTGHMMKEEMVLFPYVVAAEAHRHGAGPQPSGCFGTVRNPIRQMEAEHEVAGEALRQIRTVTGGYVPPSEACPTFRALYDELEQFEEDLHEHVHLENNILFPRAIEAESTPAESDAPQVKSKEAEVTDRKPTELLVDEHRVIEQVLNCLERMIDRCRVEDRLEEGPARDAIAFFREFAERSHLAKEKSYLFPVVAGTKCPQGCQPAELTARDEVHGQPHLEAMAAAIEDAAAGDRDAVNRFVEHGEAYIGLLMQDIENEEDWLFPQANRVFAADVERGVAEELQKTGSETTCERCGETFVSIADRLADHFGVARAQLLGAQGTERVIS